MNTKERNRMQEAGKIEMGKTRKKSKGKKIGFFLVGVMVLGGISYLSLAGNKNKGIQVVTTYATSGELQESISTTGNIQSEEIKYVYSPARGTILHVNVEAGDAVKAGDTLITYDLTKLEENVRQAKLQLNRSVANYDGAFAKDSTNQWKLYEATHNLAILNQQIEDTKKRINSLENELSESQRNTSQALAQERLDLENDLMREQRAANPDTKKIQEIQEALNRNSYVSQIAANSDYVDEMQQKITAAREELAGFERYKSEMESQKAASENMVMNSYDKTQYDVDKELAEITYQNTEADLLILQNGIVASFDAIVTECDVRNGAEVETGRQLLVLENSKEIKVCINATKHDLEKLAINQAADVVISGRTYRGAVKKINRMAEKNASGTPLVGVEIHLLETDDAIILGMDAKVTIYTNKAENAILIPVEAINSDRQGDFLYVVENGIVVRKDIVCGISTDQSTQILEGITLEDEIIVSSLVELAEGMEVVSTDIQE